MKRGKTVEDQVRAKLRKLLGRKRVVYFTTDNLGDCGGYSQVREVVLRLLSERVIMPVQVMERGKEVDAVLERPGVRGRRPDLYQYTGKR